MTDHERWEASSIDACLRLKEDLGLKITSELQELLYEHKKGMFIADCSDDYFGKTIPEQAALKKKLQDYLLNLGFTKEKINQTIKWI